MADITRLFMNGAAPAGTRPVRQPPGPPAAAALLQAAPAPALRSMPLRGAADAAGGAAAPSAEIALLDTNGAPGYSALLDAARALAGCASATVGLVACDGEYLRVIHLDGTGQPAAARLPCAAPQSGADVQMARTLYALKSRVQRWLIALPRFQEHLARSILASSGAWLLISGTDNDALIASYRTLKGVCALLPAGAARPHAVRLLVQTSDPAESARVHARLNHVARGFLEQELQAVDVAAGPAPAVESALALRVEDLGSSAVEAAWYAVLDFVHEITGSAPIEEELHSPDPDEPMPAAPAPAPQRNLPARDARALDTPVPDDADAPLDKWPTIQNRAFSLDLDAGDISSALDPEERTVLAECMADLLTAAPGSGDASGTADASDAFAATPADEAGVAVVDKPGAAARVVSTPAVAVATAPAALAATGVAGPALPALGAVSLAGADGEMALWNALRPAVRELIPSARVLEAAPPHDRASTLLLDSAGRLHVALLADADPLRWAGLWQWACDHRLVLALTRGAETLDASAEVQVHVILPPDAAGPPIRGLPVRVRTYRVQRVRFADQLAAVIIPHD
jgi:hypothetical protein